uniref:Uncharacterized protein n=1 Tax=viral metagenome TaxID=1070528 RepID=A0A6C0J8M2_9ZZZZ
MSNIYEKIIMSQHNMKNGIVSTESTDTVNVKFHRLDTLLLSPDYFDMCKKMSTLVEHLNFNKVLLLVSRGYLFTRYRKTT